jgi:quercetin dioxygenase-like cupin family protein
MKFGRREILLTAGGAITASAMPALAFAQMAPGGPRFNLIVRQDLVSQGQTVQESVLNIAEFGPGMSSPWHMHPGAQEILFVLDGLLTVEIESKGTTRLKAGDAVIIAAEIPHVVRNENAGATSRALAIYSRSDKAKPFVMPVKKAT